MSTTTRRDGSRVYPLLRPFKTSSGQTVEELVFAPVTLDHQARWSDGRFPGPLSLMAELAGIRREDLGFMTYPDAAFALEEFTNHLPPGIRTDILNGRLPAPAESDRIDLSDRGADFWGPDSPEDDPLLREPQRHPQTGGKGFGGPPIDMNPGERPTIPVHADPPPSDGAGLDLGE